MAYFYHWKELEWSANFFFLIKRRTKEKRRETEKQMSGPFLALTLLTNVPRRLLPPSSSTLGVRGITPAREQQKGQAPSILQGRLIRIYKRNSIAFLWIWYMKTAGLNPKLVNHFSNGADVNSPGLEIWGRFKSCESRRDPIQKVV